MSRISHATGANQIGTARPFAGVAPSPSEGSSIAAKDRRDVIDGKAGATMHPHPSPSAASDSPADCCDHGVESSSMRGQRTLLGSVTRLFSTWMDWIMWPSPLDRWPERALTPCPNCGKLFGIEAAREGIEQEGELSRGEFIVRLRCASCGPIDVEYGCVETLETCGRVVLDDAGIGKMPDRRFDKGFVLNWDEIEHWTITNTPDEKRNGAGEMTLELRH